MESGGPRTSTDMWLVLIPGQDDSSLGNSLMVIEEFMMCGALCVRGLDRGDAL